MEAAIWIYLYLLIGNLSWLPISFSVGLFLSLLLFVVSGLQSAWGAQTRGERHYSWERTGDLDALSPESVVHRGSKRLLKVVGPATAVLLVLGSAYPSKQDLAWIFGGATVYSLTQNEEAQKMPGNLMRAANTFLEGIAADEPETAE